MEDTLIYSVFQFGFGQMFPEMPGRNFNQTYRCYSVTMLGDREDVERGGKSWYQSWNLVAREHFCAYIK